MQVVDNHYNLMAGFADIFQGNTLKQVTTALNIMLYDLRHEYISMRSQELGSESYSMFRDEFIYLNALYYLVVSCKDSMKEKLTQELDIDKGAVAIGMVTHSISNTQFQSVLIKRNDGLKMVDDFDNFIQLTNYQVIVSSHRMLVNYFHNLLLELSGQDLVTLAEDILKQLEDYSLSSKSIIKVFRSLGLEITENESDLLQLKRLSATRNVIEHNVGKVNAEYNTLTGYGLEAGSTALAGLKEVGEALAIAEHVVKQVNKQVAIKWPSLVDNG